VKTYTYLLGVLAVAGGAAAAGLFGKPEEVAKWFPAAKWFGERRASQDSAGGAGARAAAVEVATAVKKSAPVLIDALGTVTMMASVAVKARLDSEIVAVHFVDGAYVKQGDLLITLDGRVLEARIAESEGNLARDQVQLENAEDNLRRASGLNAKGAAPRIDVDNAKTQTEIFAAAIKADLAARDNLKVQLSYCSIRAPISGRISQAAVKVGNFVRSADTAPIATINQMAPVYVTFPVSQRNLPGVRAALAEGLASVEAIVPGETRRARGRLAMVENAVDAATGMVTVRAAMPNDDELLWPGTLVKLQVTLRVEDAVVVPSTAVQVSQQGPFVFVVRDNIATVTPIKVARLLGAETVIETGLAHGDVVVTDGHLQLTNGARVTIREPKAGA
jgi:membrane fusion protein, multidrug efflux system